MNCILYARVSTDKQAEKDLSMPAQLQLMRDYARQHDWTVIEEFLEPGASAKTAERPMLQRLLSAVREATMTIDVVLVHKIDRLARNVYDHAMIKAFLKQHGIRLASVVENVDESVSGQLVENIMASIAQFYSANLSDEVKKGMRQKVLQGGWPHRPPRGYVIVKPLGQHTSGIEVHPKEGPLMGRAFELYATGWYSMRTLARRLASEGLVARNGNPIPQAHIRRLLANPFYVGRVRWQDLDVTGAHPPLVSPALFEKVQDTIRRRYKDPGPKGSVKGFVLKGLAICASCRGRMTAERHGRWGYYRCSRQSYRRELCGARFCNADTAHTGVAQLCRRIQLTRAATERIQHAVEQALQSQTEQRAERLAVLAAKDRELGDKELKLTDAFLVGSVSPEAYQSAAAGVKQQQADVDRERAHVKVDPDDVRQQVAKTLGLATSFLDLYDNMDAERRAELLRTVFAAVVVGPAGVVGFTLRPPFDVLLGPGRDGGGERESAQALLNAA